MRKKMVIKKTVSKKTVAKKTVRRPASRIPSQPVLAEPKEFFPVKPEPESGIRMKPQLSLLKVLGIMFAAGTVMAIVLIGIIVLFIFRFKARADHADIWNLDLRTGASVRLTDNGGNFFPALSPDGSRIAFSHRPAGIKSSATSIQIVDLKTRQIRTLADDPDFKTRVSWSPDGSGLYYRTREAVKKIRLADASIEIVVRDARDEDTLCVSPDGNWIAFLQDDPAKHRQLYLQATSGGSKQCLTHITTLLSWPRALAWSPDSREIALLSSLQVSLFDLQGRPVQAISLVGLVNPEFLVFHPQDKNTLFVTARTNALGIGFSLVKISRVTSSLQAVHAATILSHYCISPDGTQLYFEK